MYWRTARMVTVGEGTYIVTEFPQDRLATRIYYKLSGRLWAGRKPREFHLWFAVLWIQPFFQDRDLGLIFPLALDPDPAVWGLRDQFYLNDTSLVLLLVPYLRTDYRFYLYLSLRKKKSQILWGMLRIRFRQNIAGPDPQHERLVSYVL